MVEREYVEKEKYGKTCKIAVLTISAGDDFSTNKTKFKKLNRQLVRMITIEVYQGQTTDEMEN